MCKIGDIIVVDKYIGDDGKKVGRHSFVVLSVDKGEISGVDYDLVTNAISSIKNSEHKKKILKRKTNMLINMDDEDVVNSNHKEGFIKAGCLVYFRKKDLNYFTLGSLTVETWEALEDLIEELNNMDLLIENTYNIDNKVTE